MKKIIFIGILLITFSVFSQSKNYKRNTITISGKILEESSKQGLEYTTIVFTNTKTKKISGGIANTKGKFSIPITPGNYEIKVEFIGFKTKKLGIKTLNKNTNLGTIFLSEDTENLDEVEIVAEKSTVEIRLDKKIYNVGKDMTIKGGNASDVLDNVPSVNVDTEGTVSLRGNENVRILIDGKPSALVGLKGTDALRNLPADAIEKVEVITSPSSRYDAEGTAGILNIILRKGKIKGLNGSLNLTTGIPFQIGLGGNLNYRTNKFNLFVNPSAKYKKAPGNSFSKFTDYENGIVKKWREEDREFDRTRKNINTSIGIEYYLTKNSSITGSFFYQKTNNKNETTNITDFFAPNKVKTEERFEDEKNNSDSKQFSLNYTNNFDKKGQKLIVNFQYNEKNDNDPSSVSVDQVLSEKNLQVTNSKTKLAQIDYVLPIGKNNQFEIGHKSQLEKLFSDFMVRDGNENKLDIDPSNAINFKNNVYAFYAQFGSKIANFSYLLGVRTEITDIDLELITNNEFSDKNYIQWFPTINLGYEFDSNQTLNIGASRRLKRPFFWFLNPFETRSSATNVFKGNPDLNPSTTTAYDIGYNSKIGKLNFGTSVYYRYSNNTIKVVSTLQKRDVNNVLTNVTIKKPINVGVEKRLGVEFTSNYSISKNIRLSGSFNYFNFTDSPFSYTFTTPEGTKVTTDFKKVTENRWGAKLNTRILLPAKIQWQTRITYRGPQTTAQSDRKGVFATNVSLSRDFFNDNATMVLNVSDLFNTRKRNGTSYIGGRKSPISINEGNFQWQERQISLNFTYRFKQKKKRQRPQRNYDGGEMGF